jgi:hypothetical protein
VQVLLPYQKKVLWENVMNIISEQLKAGECKAPHGKVFELMIISKGYSRFAKLKVLQNSIPY